MVNPNIAMDIMLYTYCDLFKVNPIDAKNTPIELITKMLVIHSQVKSLEMEELEKAKRKVN